MKLCIYYPDSWSELAIDVRVSLPRGDTDRSGVAWWFVKQPTESLPSDVEVRLEDDGED